MHNESTSRTQGASGAQSSQLSRKRLIAVGIGNYMEWFDFAIYGYFAAAIGSQFFPSENPTTSVLASFTVFAVGFIARPVGGLILGYLGDRLGRKVVLYITVLGMGIATTLIGLLPPYEVLGITAPILLVVLRLIQGAAVGGEWSSASTYIVETAPPGRRAITASLITFSAGLAFLTGTNMAAVINAALPDEDVNSYGWRIPFVLSGLMAVVAIYIRRQLEESPVFESVASQRAAGEVPKHPFNVLARAFLLSLAFSTLFGVTIYYLITYANTYLTMTVGLDPVQSLTAVCIGLIAYVLVHPYVARLVERWGRRPVVLASAAGYVVLGLPMFMLLSSGNVAAATVALVIHGVLLSMNGIVGVVLLIEVFPASVRATGAAVGYNVASAAFAGTTPLIGTALVELTGSNLAPAYYLVGIAAICGLILYALLPETKGVDISA